MNTRIDLYRRVTDSIIADLERGVRPWLKPWNAEHLSGSISRPLRANGQPYKGINVLMLWAAAMSQNFTAPIWMTFKQAKEMNASIRKGSKGSLVVYSDHITRTETNHDGEECEREIYFMRSYHVFNAEQIVGLPLHFYAPAAPQLDPVQRIEAADRFFANTGADIRQGGNHAFYAPGPDYVQMPPFESFIDAESHSATLGHEIVHWTKHPTRLNRDFGRSRFGDQGYAREELVAEIGAAFLCCDLGITPEPRGDHASYLNHWLTVLREDHRAIFQAAAHAQKAVDFLHGLQPNRENNQQHLAEVPAGTLLVGAS